MSAPYVTIGGKEVDLSSGSASFHRPLANVRPVTAQPKHRTTREWPTSGAALVGLLAALSLLIMFVVWLSQQRH